MADRTVTTIEEIEALPDDAVLRDSNGVVWAHSCSLVGPCKWFGGIDWIRADDLALMAPLTVLVAEQEPESTETEYRLTFTDSPPSYPGVRDRSVIEKLSKLVNVPHVIEEQTITRSKWRPITEENHD